MVLDARYKATYKPVAFKKLRGAVQTYELEGGQRVYVYTDVLAIHLMLDENGEPIRDENGYVHVQGMIDVRVRLKKD